MAYNIGSQTPFQLTSTRGSPVVVGYKSKSERIRETMVDLKLAIDGCIAQDSGQTSQSIAALARACSIFLRKMVIGDRDDRKSRLLDDEICRTEHLRFDRIRKISKNRKALTLIELGIDSGHFTIAKLDDETLEPGPLHTIPIGKQGLKITVEWPLPGMADWTDQPTNENPWRIRVEELFDSQPSKRLDCDSWLGQQLVMFDKKGISLKEIIRVTTNVEGAHSLSVDRLMRVESEGRSNVVENSHIHILSHVEVCGVRYNHAVVVATALYLYQHLILNTSIERPRGELNIPVFHFVPDDVFSPEQKWLHFDGGVTLSLGSGEQFTVHSLRAPGRSRTR